MHNTELRSQNETRRQVSKLSEQLAQVLEELKEIRSFSETAAVSKKAEQMEDADVALLKLPWTAMYQIHDALANGDKKLAIHRILNSKLVTKDPTHIVTEAFTALFHKDIVGRLFVKTPAG